LRPRRTKHRRGSKGRGKKYTQTDGTGRRRRNKKIASSKQDCGGGNWGGPRGSSDVNKGIGRKKKTTKPDRRQTRGGRQEKRIGAVKGKKIGRGAEQAESAGEKSKEKKVHAAEPKQLGPRKREL